MGVKPVATRISRAFDRYRGVPLSISDIADEAKCSYTIAFHHVRKLYYQRRVESSRAERGRVYWQGERLI